MTDNSQQTSSQSITKMIEQVLKRGETALVVTKVAGPGTDGAKLLIPESGDTIGSLGDPGLDSIVASQATRFLASRDDTRMFSVNEFAPGYSFAGETLLLFERIQPPPRLVVCGAGHVG